MQSKNNRGKEYLLKDAETKLSRPRFGPDAEGYAYYDEGIYILWRQDAPRTPVFIMVFPEYLGEIPMPTPLKPITIETVTIEKK